MANPNYLLTIDTFPKTGRHVNEVGYANRQNVLTEHSPAVWLMRRRALERQPNWKLGRTVVSYAHKLTAAEKRELAAYLAPANDAAPTRGEE